VIPAVLFLGPQVQKVVLILFPLNQENENN
jgi:hypothetical protein